MKKQLKFITFYIVLGGLFAALLLWLFPQLRETPKQADQVQTQQQPESYSGAIQKALPAVVSISVKKLVVSGGQSRLIVDDGSGVIVDPKGYIVTNFHVIKDAREVLIELYDGRVQLANIVGIDPDTDLAVLHISLEELPYLSLEHNNSTKVGDLVFAIGSPYRLGQTVTMGIVSAVRNFSHERDDLELIQTDATINPGNSGGALINANGNLIGINSINFNQRGNSVGISFALASSIVYNVVNDLTLYGRVKRGWLGASGGHPSLKTVISRRLPTNNGILIDEVYPDSPAEKAGLQKHDYITHANGQIITTIDEFRVKIANSKPGDTFRMTVFRDNDKLQLEAKLVERPLPKELTTPQ